MKDLLEEALRLAIEASILRVALESVARKGTPEGTVFSPAHMAKKEAERIVQLIKDGDYDGK